MNWYQSNVRYAQGQPQQQRLADPVNTVYNWIVNNTYGLDASNQKTMMDQIMSMSTGQDVNNIISTGIQKATDAKGILTPQQQEIVEYLQSITQNAQNNQNVQEDQNLQNAQKLQDQNPQTPQTPLQEAEQSPIQTDQQENPMP